MSKQEKSTILLLENMQKALDKSNKIIEEQAIQIKFLKEQNELQAQRSRHVQINLTMIPIVTLLV